MTLAVVAGAFFVRLGLQFNNNIFNSPEVQTGFSVSLAIANLGFVLGIIIIAIATIIRNQTYGIKQLLWKLVFMAILVNFGLVIMAPIVGFADSMSNYFINATSPSSATGGYEGYVTTMAQAFAPQTMTPANSVKSVGCSGAAAGTGTAAVCNLQTNVGSTAQAGSPDSLTQEILSMVFGIVFLAVTAFTFFCLAILLVIRYLMLAGLLIVLPLAWLTYVFPKFDNSFSKWWNTFVKWTFFPPLALFFIYLAFLTAANTGGAATQNAYLQQAAGLPTNAAQGPEGALVYQTGLGGAIQQAADEVLLVGLTIMGLMFALSLSGKAGSTVVNGATTASIATAGYVGRRGKRMVGDRLRTAGKQYNPETKETTSWLQRQGSKLQGVPVLRTVGAAAANFSAPKAVQEERKEDIKKYTSEKLTNIDNAGLMKLANSKTAFADPTKAGAMAQELAKRDLITKLATDKQEKYLSYAEKVGTADAVYSNRPDLMPPRTLAAVGTPGTAGYIPPRMEAKQEAVARAIGNAKGDVINVNSEIFNYTDPAGAATKLGMNPATAAEEIKSAILKLTPAQLGALGSDTSSGSQARQNNLTESIKKIIADNGLKTTNATTGLYELDKTKLAALVAAAPSKHEADGLRNIEKIVNHMKGNFNFGDVLN
jgi:hypothetical protein